MCSSADTPAEDIVSVLYDVFDFIEVCPCCPKAKFAQYAQLTCFDFRLT